MLRASFCKSLGIGLQGLITGVTCIDIICPVVLLIVSLQVPASSMTSNGTTKGIGPIDGPEDHLRCENYGEIVRHLTHLCRQVDTLGAPMPALSTSDQDGHGITALQDGVQHLADGAESQRQNIIDMPKLVLVGGQSTGKSSLVECLAGVSLPRSQGTCTRGPLDVAITPTKGDSSVPGSRQWSAIVSLIVPPPTAGQPSTTDLNHRRAPNSMIQFGDPITEPDEVAEQLRRATLAVRNLSKLVIPRSSDKGLVISDSPYQLMSSAKLQEAEEDNSIPTFFPIGARLSLSLSAPGVDPLHFTDLPGLISQGSTSDIMTIKDMIAREISQENAIIVLTASLAMDVQHQNVFSLVETIDPLGLRTVGVLTMPDRMPFGAERQWAKLVNSSSEAASRDRAMSSVSHSLALGWYVVRCPAQDEDRSQIQQIEQDFFQDAQSRGRANSWHRMVSMLNDGDNAAGREFVKSRCGLHNVYKRLSLLLLQQIRLTLPQTISSVTDILKGLQRQHSAASGVKDISYHTFQHQQAVPGFGTGFTPQALGGLNHNRQLGRVASRRFPGLKKLCKIMSEIVDHFQFSTPSINSQLAPRLLRQLQAMAPRHIPFTATEARDRELLPAYKPRPWSFSNALATSEGIVTSPETRNGDSGEDHTAETALSKQNTDDVTLDQVIHHLRSSPCIDESTSYAYLLERNHDWLRERLQGIVRDYAEFVRGHLSHLIKNMIPSEFDNKYAQLCQDIVAIAEEYVHRRLTDDMHSLSQLIAEHTLAENRGVGDNLGYDGGVRQHQEQGAQQNEYARWVAGEMLTFSMLRMSLIAKEREEMGDQGFVAGMDKTLDFYHEHGLLKHSRHQITWNDAMSASAASSSVGRGPSNPVETEEVSGQGTVDAPLHKPEAPARKKKPSSKASASASASAVVSTPAHEEPTPRLEQQSNSANPSSSAKRPAARKRIVPLPLTYFVPPHERLAAPFQSASGHGVQSTPKLTIHRQLAFGSSILLETDPWMYTALKLIAALRGDFNFFSLLVVQEAQRIPISVMKGLRSHLRTVSETFGDSLSDDEIYKRYFYEADKPRREREEWMQQLEVKLDGLSAVLAELEDLNERLRTDGGSRALVTSHSTHGASSLGRYTQPWPRIDSGTVTAASSSHSSLSNARQSTLQEPNLGIRDLTGHLTPPTTPQKKRSAHSDLESTSPRFRYKISGNPTTKSRSSDMSLGNMLAEAIVKRDGRTTAGECDDEEGEAEEAEQTGIGTGTGGPTWIDPDILASSSVTTR